MKKFLFLLLLAVSATAQLQKIEPPFWYAGMQHSDLQIMCYGPKISQYKVSTSNGVIIKNIQKTENPNYVFVTVDTQGLPAQTFDINFTTEGAKKPAFTQSYELKKRRDNSRLRKGFDASDVIYLIMSDRFANGNPANHRRRQCQTFEHDVSFHSIVSQEPTPGVREGRPGDSPWISH